MPPVGEAPGLPAAVADRDPWGSRRGIGGADMVIAVTDTSGRGSGVRAGDPADRYGPEEGPQSVDELPPETALFDVLMEALPGDKNDDVIANGIIATLEQHADVVERWLETQRTHAYLSLPEGTPPRQAGELAYSLLRNWGFVTHAQITKKGLHFGATLPKEEAEHG